MSLRGCFGCLKFLVFVVNFLFWLFGTFLNLQCNCGARKVLYMQADARVAKMIFY
jgi:hypothetical protein